MEDNEEEERDDDNIIHGFAEYGAFDDTAMEKDEEVGDDDNIIVRGFAKYGAFDDTTMGEAEEEVAAEDEPTDDLGQAIRDAQRECESKEKIKFERKLEDHQKLLYVTCEEGQKKLGTTLELL